MTERDIQGNCLALQQLANNFIGSNAAPGPDLESGQLLAKIAITLLESFLCDVNRISQALEQLVEQGKENQ